MSTSPEKKAANATEARQKAEGREAMWRIRAGLPVSPDADNDAYDDGVKEADEVDSSYGSISLNIMDSGRWFQQMEFQAIDPSGNPKTVRWTQVRPDAFEGAMKRIANAEAQGKKLATAVKKGGQKARKAFQGLMASVRETSETLDRYKNYHNDLDGEVQAYQGDVDGMLGYALDVLGPTLDDINRLDTANTSFLVGSRLIGGLGKLTQKTETGRNLFRLAEAGMRVWAFTTATGSAFSSDEDAVAPAQQSTSRGAGLLDWLMGRRAAAATPAGSDPDVG